MLRRVGLAMIVCALPAGAQTGSALSDSLLRWVDSTFATYASPRSPGCAVGVTRAGELAFAKGYGAADLEHGTPIAPDTRFYIASLSKQFTAMSIVLLAEDHRLSLDDSVRKWVPEVPPFGAGITLRQLLHHTSGLRDYITLLGISGWPSDGTLTEREFLDLVSRQRGLNFAPGDEFLYSNTGYALLAIVAERASGSSLREFANEHIFNPLGMTHTEFRDDHRETIPNAARGYETDGVSYRQSNPELDVVGDGGVYSTVGDLAKWDANFRTGRVGGAAGIAMMQEAGRLNDGETVPYGLGLSIGELWGTRTYSHSGAYGGFRSTLLRLPSKDLSVITLCNTSTAPVSLAEHVGTVLLGLMSPHAPATMLDISSAWSAGSGAIPFDSIGARRRGDLLAQLAGEYYSGELDLRVSLAPREGALVLRRDRGGDIRFVPLTGDLFTSSDKMLLRLVRDGQGAVNGFTLTITRVRDLVFERRTTANGPH